MPEITTANQTPCWHFDKIPAGGMERASITGEFFSKNTPLESVIREGIQNSLDAHAEGKGAVKVRVYFSDIGATSLPAADYAKYLAGAESHLANPKNGLNNKPGPDESCVYLVLEDFNTNGLSGNVEERPPESETDPAKLNYHNYFFRESNSSKDNDGKLGSWGAGKATFGRASRLRTAFAYSVRDVQGDQRRFLAARMTLNVHADADNVRWEPHAWFGLECPEDPTQKLRYTKTPILEKKFLDAFAKDFNLSRGDEPGTSVVIPYLNLTTDDGKAAFNKANLVRVVVRNFLPALLQGDLVVEIATGDGHDKVVLDKDSVGKHSSALPEEPASDDDITKAHYAMIREALSDGFPPARVVTLKNPSHGKAPWLDEPMFSGIDLKEIKKLLQADKPVLFKVPMSVLEKSEDGKKVKPVDDEFRVVICRADFPRQVKAVYYRIGLLIGGIRGTPKNTNYAIVTLVDKGPIAKMLVAAEPPSHNEWNQTERLKARYDRPGDHIRYVREAAQFILSSVENSDNEADWDLLTDDFGIPDQGGGVEKKQRKPHEKCPVCHQWPCVCPKELPPEAILTVEKVEGEKTGFRVNMSADRVLDAAKYPFTAVITAFYPPLAWSEYDFRLDDKSTISIEYSGEGGVASYAAKDNRLAITVNKPGAFSIEVTGFDKNRDLTQNGPRYKYPEAE